MYQFINSFTNCFPMCRSKKFDFHFVGELIKPYNVVGVHSHFNEPLHQSVHDSIIVGRQSAISNKLIVAQQCKLQIFNAPVQIDKIMPVNVRHIECITGSFFNACDVVFVG